MSAKEKNTAFLIVVIFLLIVFAGINQVDTALTKLVVPEKPFASASIGYSHGFILAGPESQLHLPGLRIARLNLEENVLEYSCSKFQVRVPLLLHIGDIDKLRTMAEMLTN